MVDYPGHFVWYELITTDMGAAKAFYAEVVGWSVLEASTPDLAYFLFTAGAVPVVGLMELPEQARKLGAMPRWTGYVSVNDIDVVVERIKRLGGTVNVPPTKTGIGRVSIVADPQTAAFALVEELEPGARESAELDKAGHVGWHELLADDGEKAFGFYRELFGWQKVEAETSPTGAYQSFSAGGQTIGGIVTKRPSQPVAAWLYFIDTGDVEAAAERVKAAGGKIFEGPFELPNGSWIIRCTDPQGITFALRGTRNMDAIGWSAEWGGFSSKGQLIKPSAR